MPAARAATSARSVPSGMRLAAPCIPRWPTPRRASASPTRPEMPRGPRPARGGFFEHRPVGLGNALGPPGHPPGRRGASPLAGEIRLEREALHGLRETRDLVAANRDLVGERVGQLAEPARVRDDERQPEAGETAHGVGGLPHRGMAKVHGEGRGRSRAPEVLLGEVAAELHVLLEAGRHARWIGGRRRPPRPRR